MKDKTNADLQSKQIEEIEKIIGYRFRDKSLLIQSFTRSSYCNEHRDGRGEEYQSNEVLEFFGDSVLSAVVVTCLLQEKTARYAHGIRTRLNEGDFSVIKSRLSDKKNLSECTARLGLQKYLQVGDGDRKQGITEEPSVMEDLFESIVGAVYVDSDMNMPTVIKVVKGMLDIGSYLGATSATQNAKNLLQEYCVDKKRRLPQPEYRTVSESGPDHKKVYVRGVYLGDRLIAVGEGKNQKLADTEAAANALAILRKSEEKTPSVSNKQGQNRQKKQNTSEKNATSAKADRSADTAKKAAPKPVKAAQESKPKAPRATPITAARPVSDPEPKTPALDEDFPEISFYESLTTPKPRKEKARSFAEYLERLTAEPGVAQTNVYTKPANPINGRDIKTKAKEQGAPKSQGQSKEQNKPVKQAPPNGQSRPAPTKTVISESDSPSARLKTYAQNKKLPTPTYSDLGQVKEGGRDMCRVECRFMGQSKVALADSRLSAKNAAAEMFLKQLQPPPSANGKKRRRR